MIDKVYAEIMKPNLQLIAVFFILFLLLTEKIETNSLLIFIVLILILVYHKDIFQLIEPDSKEIKTTNLTATNKKIKTTILFDKQISDIVKELKRYKKYNKVSYKEGYHYLKLFSYSVQELEHNEIDHYRNTFENAQLYLTKSCNSFQSLSVSVPSDNYLNSLKFKKDPLTKSNNKSEQIGELCKQLNTHCSHILYNLSLRLNEEFYKNPDYLKKEIIIDTDNVKESNQYTSHEMY